MESTESEDYTPKGDCIYSEEYGPEPELINKPEFESRTIVFEKEQKPHVIEPRYGAFSWSLLGWLSVLIIFTISFIAIKNNGLFCDSPLNNETKIKMGEMIADANFSSNPCENMWEYACGNYVDTHLNESILYELQQSNLARVSGTLRTISQTYIAYTNTDENNNRVLNTSGIDMANLGYFSGYALDIMPDFNNPLEYAIYVTQDNTTAVALTDYIPIQPRFLGCGGTELSSFLMVHSNIKQYMFVDATKACVSYTAQEKYLAFIQTKSLTAQLLEFYPEMIGAAYYQTVNPNETAIQALTQQMRSAAISFVSTAWWFDETSRKRAIAKLKALQFHIGYGKTMSGDCSHLFSSVDPAVDYLTCSMRAFTAVTEALSSTPNGSKEWQMSAVEANAYYTPLFNAIYIPYGIAQMPLFDPNLGSVFNLGGLGSIIAHEIGHSIDPSGINFDERGQHNPWMTQTAKSQMETLDQCIIGYYDQVGVDNAELTLNENFADLFSMSLFQNSRGAIPFSYFPETSERDFWVSWAQTWCRVSTHLYAGPIPQNKDVHAQSRYRVKGMAGQSPKLQRTFGCPLTDAQPVCMQK